MAKPVIIVDTDPLCLSALGFLVASLGYHPLTFSSGQEACMALDTMETTPQAIITEHDLFMTCQARCVIDSVRRRFGPIPILVLTADTSAETRAELTGIDCHVLFKPARTEDIIRLLQDAPPTACSA